MNDLTLVIADIVMVQRLKQSHDIAQTVPQIAWTLPSMVITSIRPFRMQDVR